MISVMLGVMLFFSILFAPNYGVIARNARRKKLSIKVMLEDILANLYRISEPSYSLESDALSFSRPTEELSRVFASGGEVLRKALQKGRQEGYLIGKNDNISLSENGRKEAKRLIRAHRLWESYLVDEVGLRDDHVHNPATNLEHFTADSMVEELSDTQSNPDVDPHGKRIPE